MAQYTTVKLTEDAGYMIHTEKILTETTYRDENMKCPICNATVVKVVESDEKVDTDIKCINEYGIHYQNIYEKFITPQTIPTFGLWIVHNPLGSLPGS